MKYKIEKNIPIKGTKRPSKYPFDKMQVGDSFLVDNEKAGSIRSLIYRVGGKKFRTRSVKGGIRVWRVG